jgi:hypothetical protein
MMGPRLDDGPPGKDIGKGQFCAPTWVALIGFHRSVEKAKVFVVAGLGFHHASASHRNLEEKMHCHNFSKRCGC